MNRALKNPFTAFLFLLLLTLSSTAMGQVSGVQLSVPKEQLGLEGFARVGTWTPIRLSLENQGAEPRQVVCRWLLKDADGDRVHAERRITLDALSKQDAWLYGPLPIRWNVSEPWIVQILNETADEVLASDDKIAPPELMIPSRRLIGITGSYSLGLDRHIHPYTSHEAITLVTGMSLTTLPDRWYGLSMIDTLVWTRYGGDPNDPLVSSASQQALREWVRRGGHLVIMLPAYGETWTGSAMSDLLPIKADDIERIEGPPPSWAGARRGAEVVNVAMSVFYVNGHDDVDVVQTHNNRPIIVTKRFGFGRVTVSGLDLSDRSLASMGLPNGRNPVWNTIFMWQAPIYEKDTYEAKVQANEMSRVDQRSVIPLGRFIPGRVSMRGAAAPALLLAILVFGLYWFAAGPLSVIVLKKQNATRQSWLIFVAIVLVFSAFSWAGAWLMAPKSAQVTHFSVLTASADSPTVHTHSWMSIYTPTFSKQLVEIDPEHPSAKQVMSSPGMVVGLDETAFLDPQTYSLDAASPRSAEIPFRSTAKQIEVDYMGRVDISQQGMAEPLILPQGKLKIVNNWPTGKLSHALPGALRDVRVLYCPGGGQVPKVMLRGDPWEPKQVIDLTELMVSEQPELVKQPGDKTYEKRSFKDEGYLGRLISNLPGQNLIDATGQESIILPTDFIRYIELLSFFDALPAPDFVKTGIPYTRVYQRSLGRQFDLTPLFAGRRVIVMGHLEDSPLPLPLTVGGEEIPSNGWTVVRWVYDFE